METGIDLKELVMLLLHKWRIIAVACLSGALIAFLVSKFVVSPLYLSSVSLYVNNTSGNAALAALNINDINASQKLVNTYIVILQNDEVMEQVCERLLDTYEQEDLAYFLPFSTVDGEKVLRPETLRERIKLSAVNNTEVLQIQAQTQNPLLSARICTILTELAPSVLTRVVKAGSVEVIGMAKPATSPSSPNIEQNTILGFLLGGLFAVGILLLLHLTDNRVKGEEELKKRYNIPILGEVPDWGRGGNPPHEKAKKGNGIQR